LGDYLTYHLSAPLRRTPDSVVPSSVRVCIISLILLALKISLPVVPLVRKISTILLLRKISLALLAREVSLDLLAREIGLVLLARKGDNLRLLSCGNRSYGFLRIPSR